MNLNHITVNIQSSIRLEGSKILYFDPFKIGNESHDADMIFVTHEHFDHFEPDSIAKVKKESTILVAPESMKKKVLAESGIVPENCLFCKPSEMYEQDGIQIGTIPAYNKLKPFHPKMNKWLGYVVKMDDVRYYVAGDTDVNEHMEHIQCDVALIPIGGHYTMDKKQAAEYIARIKPAAVIPIHYGSIVGDAADGQKFADMLQKLSPDIQVELKLQ